MMLKEHLSRLFSFLVAIFLFWYIRSDVNSSYVEVHPPIEVKGIPDGKVAIVNRESQLKLTLRGPSTVLAKFVVTPPLVRFQLPQGTVNGTVTLPVDADDIALPPFVSLVSHVPDSVQVVVDDVLDKELPVVVKFEGKTLPPGVRIVSSTTIPALVSVRGPSSKMKGYSVINTMPIPLNAIDVSFEREVFLKLPMQEMIEATPTKVLVRVVVEKINNHTDK